MSPPKNPKRKSRPHSFPRPLSAGGKCSLGFAKSKSPENSFRKTESALVPPPDRILGGQNPKKKNVLSILEKIHRPRKSEKQGTFFLFGVAERSEANLSNLQFPTWCPRQESNLHFSLRRAVSCPLNDKGVIRISKPER